MTTRITVLGAGFGGLELCTILSESLGDKIEVTLTEPDVALRADKEMFGASRRARWFGL